MSNSAITAVGKGDSHRVLCFHIENPVYNDVIPIFQPTNTITITKVIASTIVATSTVDFNLERRGATTVGTSGTDILNADLQADTNSSNTTSFANSGTVVGGEYIVYCASDAQNTPTNLIVTIEFDV